MTKGKWILMLLAGVILMLLSFPAANPGEETSQEDEWTRGGYGTEGSSMSADGDGGEEGEGILNGFIGENTASEDEYEALLEERIKVLLQNVEGVGQVDVLVVLKSSQEKVYRVDTSTSLSETQEEDSQGGTRRSQSSQVEENTLLAGGASGQGGLPLVEKELRPEISGIVISAQGGGSPEIQAEISAAMEALFGLPAHKIKVLKRVD